MKEYCKPIYENFGLLSLPEFSKVIEALLQVNTPHQQDVSTDDAKNTNSVAKRLITGLAAENYFRENFSQISHFQGTSLKDTTSSGCGYDFELYGSNEKLYCVEVKGLAEEKGNILLTSKEYEVAGDLKGKYGLFIVKNFKKSPFHNYIFDPIESDINFRRIEKKIIQISYSAYL